MVRTLICGIDHDCVTTRIFNLHWRPSKSPRLSYDRWSLRNEAPYYHAGLVDSPSHYGPSMPRYMRVSRSLLLQSEGSPICCLGCQRTRCSPFRLYCLHRYVAPLDAIHCRWPAARCTKKKICCALAMTWRENMNWSLHFEVWRTTDGQVSMCR